MAHVNTLEAGKPFFDATLQLERRPRGAARAASCAGGMSADDAARGRRDALPGVEAVGQGNAGFTRPANTRAESNAAPVVERGGRIAGARKGDFAR